MTVRSVNTKVGSNDVSIRFLKQSKVDKDCDDDRKVKNNLLEDTRLLAPNDSFSSPITPDELRLAIRNLKRHKAAG